MREVLVVGGGVSGLYAALLVARRGLRVRVLERGPRPGGLAGREVFRGIPCDLGSHRLHAEALEQPLFRELHAHEPLLERPRRGVLLLGDRRVPYPPSAAAMVRALGPRASLAMGVGLVTSSARRRAWARWDGDRAGALAPRRDPRPRSLEREGSARDPATDVGFERFVTERVGEAAYRAFYAPYAEKVWGLPPAELSQTVAKKRVSSTHPWALFRSAAVRALATVARLGDEGGARGSGPETSIEARFLYPAGGTASIVDYLERELGRLGVPIACGQKYRADEARGAPVLFAGDLADLVPTTLDHRGIYLVYVALPLARAPRHETYYAPDPRFWFGRVSEISSYSPALAREGEAILCVEIPEGAWGDAVDFTSGARRDALLGQLERAGIVPPGLRPLEVHQRFVPRVYPIYRRGWIDEWRRAMQRVAALGVLPLGRQALFLHCNLDHCAAIAADAVAHLESALSGSSSAGARGQSPHREWARCASSWVEHAERYLEIRVRD